MGLSSSDPLSKLISSPGVSTSARKYPFQRILLRVSPDGSTQLLFKIPYSNRGSGFPPLISMVWLLFYLLSLRTIVPLTLVLFPCLNNHSMFLSPQKWWNSSRGERYKKKNETKKCKLCRLCRVVPTEELTPGLYIAKVVDTQGVMHIFKLLCY